MKEIFKNKKIMMASAAAVVIVIIIIAGIRKKRAEEADMKISGGNGASGGDPSGSSSQLPKASFPLTPYSMAGEYSAVKGSYGQQIANLQKICNAKFGKSLAVDGKFGPKSEDAFRACFGYLFNMPYDEAVYNGFMLQHGGGLGLA